MKTAEKKLNIIQSIIRFNFSLGSGIVGAIEGNVNTTLKKGAKFVSVNKEGNVVFWCTNDFDVIVTPEDVVGCKLVDAGKIGGQDSSASSRGYWYGPVFELTFANGTTGCLVVNTFRVEHGEYQDPGAADIPKVDGWLAPDGTRDEHYNDVFCPEGYKPNVVCYCKSVRDFSGESKMPSLDKALKLSERFPEVFEEAGVPKGVYIFNGTRSTNYIRAIKNR